MKYLFTDLDGTFIPENENSKLSLNNFKEEQNNKVLELIYVTGRNLEETKDAIKKYSLPKPNYLICDVGSTIYKKTIFGYFRIKKYWNKQKQIVNEFDVPKLKNVLNQVKSIKLQEASKQNRYKLSYYFNKEVNILKDLKNEIENIPWNSIVSLTDKVGLLDFLPKGVNKYYAICWLVDYINISLNDIIFAGDSGNDLEVFLTDIKSIVVNNTPDSIKKMLKDKSNIFFATKKFTEGVFEGYKYYI